MSGFTVVLIDSETPEEGDFAYVASYASLADLDREEDKWCRELFAVARKLALRDAAPSDYVAVCVDGAEVERFWPSELGEASRLASHLKTECREASRDSVVSVVL